MHSLVEEAYGIVSASKNPEGVCHEQANSFHALKYLPRYDCNAANGN